MALHCLRAKETSLNVAWNISNASSRHPTVNTGTLNVIVWNPTLGHLDLSPNLDDIKKAIIKTSTSIASSIGGIPADLFKTTGLEILATFHNILASIWVEKVMPQDFMVATVISLYLLLQRRFLKSFPNPGQICLEDLKAYGQRLNVPSDQPAVLSTWSSHPCRFRINTLNNTWTSSLIMSYSQRPLSHSIEKHSGHSGKAWLSQEFTQITQLFHDGMVGHVISCGNASTPFNIYSGMKWDVCWPQSCLTCSLQVYSAIPFMVLREECTYATD